MLLFFLLQINLDVSDFLYIFAVLKAIIMEDNKK